MHITLLHTLGSAGATWAAVLAGAGILHLIPRLGPGGRRVSEMLCRAPGLDCIVTYFTAAPLIVGPALLGWGGLFGAIVGQVAGVVTWIFLHELAHPEAMRGPRIDKVLNRIFGRWRNHTAVWLTAIVTPLFWLVRMAEIFIYPLLTKLVQLPPYPAGEWVNVSRHKFSGLVGHDLIWCLYCDWMTGIWSLGSEMLRNIEAFWCPIRFASDRKCENCVIDFPDLNNGWVEAGGTMQEVSDTIDRMYSNGQRGWFGHRVRITVNGEALKAAPAVVAE